MSLIAARRYSSFMHGSASGSVGRLVDRHPSVSPERLIAQLRPPPTFAGVSFATYRPDPAEPT
jgi:cell division protein ZapE